MDVNSGEFVYKGQTEFIKNEHDPVFKTPIMMSMGGVGSDDTVELSVFDVHSHTSPLPHSLI
jgi:hypothetical protein